MLSKTHSSTLIWWKVVQRFENFSGFSRPPFPKRLRKPNDWTTQKKHPNATLFSRKYYIITHLPKTKDACTLKMMGFGRGISAWTASWGCLELVFAECKAIFLIQRPFSKRSMAVLTSPNKSMRPSYCLEVPLLVNPYLEDHPRICNWLGSLPCISRGVRPFGRGPITLLRGEKLTMVINHYYLGWSSK